MRSSLQGSWIGSEERWLDFAKATGAQHNPKKRNTTRPGRWQPLSRPPSRLHRDSDAGTQSAVPVFANPASRRKSAVGGRVCAQKSVHFQQPKGQRVNSGQGRKKAMFSFGSRILAVIAAGVLFVRVHSIRAAEFAGSVQGGVNDASVQALSGMYVTLITPEKC